MRYFSLIIAIIIFSISNIIYLYWNKFPTGMLLGSLLFIQIYILGKIKERDVERVSTTECLVGACFFFAAFLMVLLFGGYIEKLYAFGFLPASIILLFLYVFRIQISRKYVLIAFGCWVIYSSIVLFKSTHSRSAIIYIVLYVAILLISFAYLIIKQNRKKLST
jgi:hypothetical protein